MMRDALERDVRFLKRYAVFSTLAFCVVALAAFTRQGQKAKFTEIDVERINILEPDGKYRMVLSNRPRSIGPIYKGEPFGYAGGGRPGIIFFNDEGSENGGLTFTGRRGPDGKYASSIHMSFDQFDQDQVLNLDYADNNGQRRVGMSVDDRADVNIYDWVLERDSIMKIADSASRAAAMERHRGPRNGVPLVARRVFVGRDQSKAAVVNLSARDGKPRLRLMVDSLGVARIEFLDADGRTIYILPDTTRRGGL
jgi:catechol 2,3-dioxygenase-like lactoylglutathione lyase family enzyme